MTELKPCPFCGGDVESGYYADEFVINCPACRYEVSTYNDGPSDPSIEGIMHWNTRADTGVKVKPLEWHRPEYVHETVNLVESVVFGLTYRAWGGGAWGVDGEHNLATSDRTLGAAKAAAQADYERRVLSAIE